MQRRTGCIPDKGFSSRIASRLHLHSRYKVVALLARHSVYYFTATQNENTNWVKRQIFIKEQIRKILSTGIWINLRHDSALRLAGRPKEHFYIRGVYQVGALSLPTQQILQEAAIFPLRSD